MPQTTSPLNLPLQHQENNVSHIVDARGMFVASCQYADEASAIVHACNTLPKLEQEKARLRDLLRRCKGALREMNYYPILQQEIQAALVEVQP